MNSQYGLKDIFLFLKRRKKILLICFIAIPMVAIVVAMALPSIYRAQVRILRESQQVSEDYVRSTITSYAEERVKAVSQQVMNFQRLAAIIEEFNLYEDQRDASDMGTLVAAMRDAINLETIYANVINERTGRTTSISTAFLLSFEGKEPLKVQQVVNRLASLYVEEDERTREKRASVTTRFFEEELDRLKEEIRKLEYRISKFKEKHAGQLPENYEMNVRAMDRLERELDRLEGRLRTIEERKLFLKAQIATVDPLLPIKTQEGKTMANPNERLKQLRLQLMSLQSKLSDKHPDVVSLRAEIADLEQQVAHSDEITAQMKHLNALQDKLARLKSTLGAKHPDVIEVENEIRAASEKIDNLSVEQIKQKISEERPDNPTYIHLQTQIVNIETEMKNIKEDKIKIARLMKEYEKKIEGTPYVEKEYKELTRDYESTQKKYDDFSNKLMEARVAQGMEDTQRGERFIISESAALPRKPYRPNRLAIILLGVMAGLAVGTGLAALQESMDNTIKTPDELSQIVGVDVFTTIAFIKTTEEIKKDRLKKLIWALGTVVAIVCGLILIDMLFIPLSQLWSDLMQKVTKS